MVETSYSLLRGQSDIKKKRDKPPFMYGQMFIAFNRNKLSYMPGEIVEGSVLVQQQEPYKSCDLRLSFYGKEKSKFSAPVAINDLSENPGQQHIPCKGHNRFIRIVTTIAKFEGNTSAPG